MTWKLELPDGEYKLEVLFTGGWTKDLRSGWRVQTPQFPIETIGFSMDFALFLGSSPDVSGAKRPPGLHGPG